MGRLFGSMGGRTGARASCYESPLKPGLGVGTWTGTEALDAPRGGGCTVAPIPALESLVMGAELAYSVRTVQVGTEYLHCKIQRCPRRIGEGIVAFSASVVAVRRPAIFLETGTSKASAQ